MKSKLFNADCEKENLEGFVKLYFLFQEGIEVMYDHPVQGASTEESIWKKSYGPFDSLEKLEAKKNFLENELSEVEKMVSDLDEKIKKENSYFSLSLSYGLHVAEIKYSIKDEIIAKSDLHKYLE